MPARLPCQGYAKMSGSDSTVQRQLEERILGSLGVSHGRVDIANIKFDFDGFIDCVIYKIYAFIDRLRSGQQLGISQDVLKMALHEKIRNLKKRAIVEYGIEVRLVAISPEERRMLEKAKEEQGSEFKNPH